MTGLTIPPPAPFCKVCGAEARIDDMGCGAFHVHTCGWVRLSYVGWAGAVREGWICAGCVRLENVGEVLATLMTGVPSAKIVSR